MHAPLADDRRVNAQHRAIARDVGDGAGLPGGMGANQLRGSDPVDGALLVAGRDDVER
jgi:hypothetical protein